MAHTPFELRSFADRVGSWLDSRAPSADVVVSCRVRLARNLDGYPFQGRLQPAQAVEVRDRLHERLSEARLDGETWWVPMGEAAPVLRQLLLERNLASRDLVDGEGGATGLAGRALAFGRTETLSVMVNEEDHVRLSALAAGLDLELAWQRAVHLDRYLEDGLSFASSTRLGYLTACPTNVGTGMRASVMLHLPALGLVRHELEKVFTAAQHTGLAVRGMHGEGSRAAGDLYQISNQVTLGRSETELLEELSSLVPHIVTFERSVREALLEEHHGPLQDRVARAFGTLRSTRALPSGEALAHLSTLRLGHYLGLYDKTSLDELGRLGLQVQQGHVMALCSQGADEVADPSERDKLRASMLRDRLAHGSS